jgi:ABC-type nitrate/sulfonate/bicarbonate transport system substrate-binding protein
MPAAIGTEITRRSMLGGIGGVAAAPSLSPILVAFGAHAAEAVNLTLPWIPEGEVAFMYAARKQSFWAKRGLDVSITRGFGSGEAAKTVGLSQYAYGQADIGAIIKAAGAGLPLVSIAMVNQRSPILVLSLKGSGITKPKDLEGRRLGGASAGAANELWPVFAKLNGIDVSKVKMVSLQPGLNIQALTNRDVDAVATVYQSSAPYLMADGVPFETMFFAVNGLDIYSLTFVTQPSRIAGSPSQVAAFVEGVMEGLKFSYLEPDATLESFVEAIPESGKTDRDRKITRHSLMINTAEGLTEAARRNGLGWHDPEKMRFTLDTVVANSRLAKPPSAEAIYTNQFVGSVKLSDAEWQRARDLAKDYLLG